MTKEVTAMEARQKFGELLDQTYYRDDQIIIKRGGKRMAALIPISVYEHFLKQRKQDFAILDRIWSKVPDVPDAEIDRDIETAIAEVRARKRVS